MRTILGNWPLKYELLFEVVSTKPGKPEQFKWLKWYSKSHRKKRPCKILLDIWITKK